MRPGDMYVSDAQMVVYSTDGVNDVGEVTGKIRVGDLAVCLKPGDHYTLCIFQHGTVGWVYNQVLKPFPSTQTAP